MQNRNLIYKMNPLQNKRKAFILLPDNKNLNRLICAVLTVPVNNNVTSLHRCIFLLSEGSIVTIPFPGFINTSHTITYPGSTEMVALISRLPAVGVSAGNPLRWYGKTRKNNMKGGYDVCCYRPGYKINIKPIRGKTGIPAAILNPGDDGCLPPELYPLKTRVGPEEYLRSNRNSHKFTKPGELSNDTSIRIVTKDLILSEGSFATSPFQGTISALYNNTVPESIGTVAIPNHLPAGIPSAGNTLRSNDTRWEESIAPADGNINLSYQALYLALKPTLFYNQWFYVYTAKPKFFQMTNN